MAYLIAFIIVFGIPYYLNKKKESCKRQDMYRFLRRIRIVFLLPGKEGNNAH